MKHRCIAFARLWALATMSLTCKRGVRSLLTEIPRSTQEYYHIRFRWHWVNFKVCTRCMVLKMRFSSHISLYSVQQLTRGALGYWPLSWANWALSNLTLGSEVSAQIINYIDLKTNDIILLLFALIFYYSCTLYVIKHHWLIYLLFVYNLFPLHRPLCTKRSKWAENFFAHFAQWALTIPSR